VGWTSRSCIPDPNNYLTPFWDSSVCCNRVYSGVSYVEEVSMLLRYYTVWVKQRPPKTFAIYSLVVNLCNHHLPWMLPNHIQLYLYTCTILVHVSEYFIYMNCMTFTSKTFQTLTNHFTLLWNSLFLVKKQITWNDM